jgi:hypothetical protein
MPPAVALCALFEIAILSFAVRGHAILARYDAMTNHISCDGNPLSRYRTKLVTA